jgi:23S rRNA pseudouridine1911/1915/1917 synthase
MSPEADAGPAPAQFEVPALLDGMRVDRAVSMLTGVSRAAVADLVARHLVLVDGQAAPSRSSPVHAGSMLTVTVDEPTPRPVAEPDVVFAVVHQDPDVVVVDKPAGLVVHPGAGRDRGTLVGGLLARFPDLATLADEGVCDPRRPGIVQRLDKGTSGLLAVARSERAYRSLVEQLSSRRMERRYVALVTGLMADERGLVDAPIGRSNRTPTRMAVSAQGRPARTRYQVLERFDGPVPLTLLSLALETGRTHQIRVHLAAIGHEVVGDDRYRSGPSRPTGPARLVASGRVFLHAAVLGLQHPATGEELRWESPLPDDLAQVLARLRRPGGPP